MSRKYHGGLFITLEGPDAAGKSTQLKNIKSWFEDLGYDVLTTREPGGTKIGEELRNLLKHVSGEDQATDLAELMMFSAARTQLLHKVIIPHLERGGIVISDRFLDSTTAYQGYGRGISLTAIHKAHDLAVGDNLPNLTFLFDLDPKVSVERNAKRDELEAIASGEEPKPCNFEKEDLDFRNRVRDGYLDIAKRNSTRFVILQAGMDIEDVTRGIILTLENMYR